MAAVILMLGFTIQTPITPIIIAGMLMGLGWGIIWGSATQMAMECVSHTLAGIASATLWTIQNMVGCLGLAICGSVFSSSYRNTFFQNIQKHKTLKQLFSQQHIIWKDPESFSLHTLNTQLHHLGIHLYRLAFTQGFNHVMLALLIASLLATLGFWHLSSCNKTATHST